MKLATADAITAGHELNSRQALVVVTVNGDASRPNACGALD
jgi:hypothetical protein